MAVTITTYNFSKRQNSTKVPASGGTNHTVTLKKPTSLIHPVFIIDGFNRTDNYLKWDSRYYFINDIVQLTNDIAEYHCNVDALASWKTQIGTQSEYIVRAASASNEAILDMLYPVTADTTYASVPLTFDNGYGSGSSYVVGVVGGATGASGGVNYYAMTASEFAQLLNFMFAGTWLDQSQTDLSLITQKQLVNPFQYIVSCYYFPFAISQGVSQEVYFGWFGSGIQGLLINDRDWDCIAYGTAPRHPQRSTRGRYLSYPPFTEYYIKCKSFGRFAIDPEYLVGNNSFTVYIKCDLFSGAGKLDVSTRSGGQTQEIYRTYSQIGVPIQMSQITQSLMHPLLDIVSGAAGILSGNFLGVLSGIGNALHDMMPQVSVSGSVGSSVDLPEAPEIEAKFRYQTPMDVTHKGKPVCDTMTISSLSGYIQCENVEVDIPCTQEERNMIETYMTAGFYYE